MRQYLLAVIAVLAAIILALFSIDTASNQQSARSYRAYNFKSGLESRADDQGSALWNDNAGNVNIPTITETVTDNGFSPLTITSSPLSTPPAMLATSAMTELTPVQLPPLDAGMVNVTGGFDGNSQTAGYRVNPRPGEFAIAVPYDPSLLPQGFTEDDIQTYVYDRQYHRWVAIQRDSVNEAELLVCSRFRPWEKGLPHTQNDLTNPQVALTQVQDMMSFAPQGEGSGDSPLDFINAVLKTPEMPETSAYTPTSIKELKAADPLEGLTLMQPPTANNSGTANLSYPIEIPAGRQGMQPNLALTYSSGGGNGWLGVGWDISIPSITVETRWGVPRYRTVWESEVYVYEGEQMVTKDSITGDFRKMAHRTNDTLGIRRMSGDVQHFPRKNEAFDSIMRHGNSPANYWWSVTHRNGVTDYYGKYVADTSVNNRCVLRVDSGTNATGAIAHWALAESVDPFGNSVKYFYDVEYNAGIVGSAVKGKQIYIDSIRYTEYILNDGTVDENGHYKVLFNRTSGRTDAIISANRGFKEVTADLLCSMEVLFEQDTIRKYVFFTENNRKSLFRTRLSDILRVDSITQEINCGTDMSSLKELQFVGTRTQFDYYDAPMPGNMFSQTKKYDHLPTDGVMSFFAINSFNVTEGLSTAIGSSRGVSWSLGGTASIGLDPNICMTTTSVGGNFDYSRSRSEGALTLIDLNGDGLADKVWKTLVGVWYRKRVPMPNDSIVYESTSKRIIGVKSFLKETNNTITWGLQASAGCSYSGGWPTTKSTTSVYFADVNADGLPDLITEDGVLFNTTQPGGDVTFKSYYDILDEQNATEEQPIVVNTTMPCDSFIFDGTVDDDIACETDWVLYRQYTFVPIVPCSSYVSCASDWWQQQIPVIELYLNADSFMVTYQYNYPDYVEWNPDVPTGYTVYKRRVRCTPKPLDPDIDAVRVWVAPENGKIEIVSRFQLLEDQSESRQQSKHVDGVRYTIQYDSIVSAQQTYLESMNFRELYSQVIGKNDYETHLWHGEIIVGKGDILFFRLQSNGNRSFDNVNWIQEITYTDGGPNGIDQYGRDARRYVSHEDFSVSGKQFFQAHKDHSKANVQIRINTQNNMGGNVALIMQYSYGGVTHNEPFTLYPGQATTIPRQMLLDQFDSIKFIALPLGQVNWGAVEITPHIRYYFQEATMNEPNHSDSLDYYPPVDIQYFNDKGTYEDYLEHGLFGPLYRGWGQFGYNNNDAHATITTPISIKKIIIDEVLVDASGHDTAAIHDTPNVTAASTLEQANAAFAAQGMYNPLDANTRWVEMHPENRYQAWVGYGNINYIERFRMTNTRLTDLVCTPETSGIPDYDHPVPQAGETDGGTPVSAKTVRKQNISELRNHSLNLGVPVVPISSGASESNGGNKILTDYMDLNGDRYPDFVGEVNVQYSMPWGGIGKIQALTQHVQGVANSSTTSEGQTYGASFTMPERTLSNDPKSTPITFDGKGNTSGNFGNGEDNTDYTFMDMNGDGLPDKVASNGSVALNIGYSFLPFEQWNSGVIRKGSSANAGLGVSPGSFDVGQASISGGIAVNGSENLTGSVLMDFNGDGLPDRVRNDNGIMRVRYNLGNGHWSQEESGFGIGNISYSTSYSESTDGGVTMGYTFFGFLKISGGVQTSPYNQTFCKDREQLIDINGDGYLDYVTSDFENKIDVRYNMTGKANLLRKVTNFTGNTIEMDYALSMLCFDKPQRSWNLDTLIVSDPNSPVAGNVSHTKFEYENPYYNRGERMDYGYKKVITREYIVGGSGDVPYRYFVEEFNNRDFTKRGRKTRDCIYDATNHPYIEHLYDATVYDFAGGEISEDGCARADVYVGVESDLTNYYEGQSTAQITTRVVRIYDRYRNVTEYIHHGDTAHKTEFFRAEISYATGKPYNLVSLPVSIVVYDDSNHLLQKRTAQYWDEGEMVRLTRFSTHNDSSVYDFSYNQYGGLETAQLPANQLGQRLTFNYTYDNTVHTYPARVDNVSLQLFSTAEYDLRFGKVTRTVDMNNNEMCYVYDYLGRCKKILAPYEIASGKPYTIRMEYNPKNYGEENINNTNGQQNFAKTFHYDSKHPDNPILTVTLTDGLGRALQTRKDAEINGLEQFIVTGRVVYDCFGRVQEQYQPFPDNSQYFTTYDPTCDPNKKTVFEYDILDRQTRITVYPFNYTTNIEYSFETVGNKTCFKTITTDAMSNADTILRGTMGQQLEQRAPLGAVTRFEYDHLGQLKRSIDPDSFIITYDYNLLGQLTRRNHPDAGDDRYKYDKDGLIICHVNAAGDSIKYKYYYNQLTDVEYPNYPANNVHYSYGTIADTVSNSAGKIKFQEDGSGFQTFKYGKLGEVTENIRTFALPFEKRTYTFKMNYEYDSWNRIQKMTYPDGEVVHYDYNFGGLLERVYGQYKKNNFDPYLPPIPHDSLIPLTPSSLNGQASLNGIPGYHDPVPMYTTYTYPYIDSIAYNEFELKSEVFYGNGTHTQYDYDDIQRLQTLQSQTRTGAAMQSITYSYDAVNNITDIVNIAGALSNGLGGIYSHYYEYDDLYRLINSHGQWDNTMKNEHLKDTVRMAYYKNGRIASKKSYANIYSEGGYGTSHATQNSRRAYNYNIQQPNTLLNVYDSVTNTSQNFSWDNSGNMVAHNGRSLSWTEDNRLQTVTDNEWFSYYQYDAGGDRTYKMPYLKTYSNRSGRRSVYWAPEHSTLYASPYLVVTPQGYTKHYYAESERITSQIGRGNFSTLAMPVTDTATANRKVRHADSLVLALNPAITDTAAQLAYLAALTNRQNDTCEAYWYHTDHLGSSSWVTDSAGNPVQHLHYLPWGEDYVNQRLNDFDGVRYTFSAKEKDAETGYSYFGSRYYSSDLSIWLIVDPMSDKYLSTSPYAYCRNNPIILVDPNGMFDTKAEARKYRREHHTGGVVRKNSPENKFAGKYSIINKREQVSYTKPQYVENDASIPMIGQFSDGVVKAPIAHDPRTIREKMDDFDRKALQKGVAIGQGLATALPITSQVNDIMILSKGENMFGDKATKPDKVWATIDLATLGVGKTFKLFEEAGGPVLKKAADYVEDVGYALNIRSWFMTTKNKWKNEKKKK